MFTDPGPRAKLRELTSLMLETIAAALSEDAIDEAQTAIKMFIELVGMFYLQLVDSNFFVYALDLSFVFLIYALRSRPWLHQA